MPDPAPVPLNPLTGTNPPPAAFARGGERVPLITIGIPAYNRPQLLAEALASIGAQRDFADFEVVVSDDGGQAETRAVVESAAVPALRYYVNEPALGAVANWNRCIELARASWVTVLHEDDLLYPWFLRLVVPQLRAGTAAVAVRCDQGKTPPAVVEPKRSAVVRRYAPLWFLKGSMTPFPGVVFPRELALQIGGFDARQGGLADYAFWYALARAGGIEVVRQSAAFYRVNEGQWTEREWPAMLRRAHLLRLRVAREQLPQRPRLGRWLARFYTARMARAYGRRFAENPAGLRRARQFERIRWHNAPSGWVWGLLKWIGRAV